MAEILTTAMVIIGVVLIIIILLQNKQSSLNLASMWGGGMEEITKRGADKVLYNTTIILGVAFVIISILLFVTS